MSDLDDLEAIWALDTTEPPRPLRAPELVDANGCGLVMMLAVLAAGVLLVVGAVVLVWLAVRWAVTS